MRRQEKVERTREQAFVDAWEDKKGREKFPGAVWQRWTEAETPEPARGSLRTLLKRWREGTATPKYRGLRAAIVAVLSEVRTVTEEELFGAGGAMRSPGCFPFHAFPALGAFDPAADEPFRAATLHPSVMSKKSGFLGSIFQDLGTEAIDLLDLPGSLRKAWVVLPPGAGRSFAANWVKHRRLPAPSPYRLPIAPPRVLSLVTPSVEALDAVGGGEALLIEIEATGDEMHAFMQRLLPRWGSWAILAPFTNPLSNPNMQVYTWRVDAAWRDGYVRWVARRLASLGNGGAQLDVAAFLGWVARIDPDVSRFRTPGDLLPLLDYANARGTETLAKQFGRTLVRRVLGGTTELVGGACVRDRWLRELGAETFTQMLETWWRTPGLRWGTDPAKETWASVVPKNAEPAFTEASERALEITRQLKNVKLTKIQREALIAELGETLTDNVPAREAVRALVGARVLRDVGIGVLSVSPPWMVEATAKSVVERTLEREAPSVWGRWCVDPARRPLVDERLLAYQFSALVALIAKAVKGFDPMSLGAVGAVETLFATVGERLASGERVSVKDTSPLKDLARLQVDLLAPHHQNGLPAPRTRVGPHETTGGARFIAVCWAWSLRNPAPSDGFLPAGSTWLFPGWAPPSVDDIPDALTFHDLEPNGGPGVDAETRGMKLMRQLLPEVLERATGTFDRVGRSREIPRSLAVAAIPLAVRREWPMAVLTSAIRSPSLDEAQRLARSIDALPAELRGQTIESLWGVALGEQRDVLQALRYFDPDRPPEDLLRSPLETLMQQRFPVDRIEAAVKSASRWDSHSGERLLRLTPDAHRVRIARALVAALADQASHSVDIFKVFGRELVEVLLEIAPLPAGWMAAQAVWEIAPEVARAHAEADYARGVIAPWISSMPQEHLGELVEVVEQFPAHPVPDELRLWLSGRLPVVGPEAERLWSLLQRAGWPPCAQQPR